MKLPCIIFYRTKEILERWEELEKTNSLDEARQKIKEYKNQPGKEHLEFKIIVDDHYIA